MLCYKGRAGLKFGIDNYQCLCGIYKAMLIISIDLSDADKQCNYKT